MDVLRGAAADAEPKPCKNGCVTMAEPPYDVCAVCRAGYRLKRSDGRQIRCERCRRVIVVDEYYTEKDGKILHVKACKPARGADPGSAGRRPKN